MLCKVASAQDHAGMCSHSHQPNTLEEPRETAPTPWGGRETPPISLQHPLLLPGYSLSFPFSNPALGLSAGHLQRCPCSRATATTWNPPVVRVPLCPHRHSCQSRSHIFGLTVPPDAGREKLNKTP